MRDTWTIKVQYWAKPIPLRRADYIAYFDGQEEEGPYGMGATLGEALRELATDYETWKEEQKHV